jgi:hypothetical protein
MASWINKCKSFQEFEKYMEKEKCIHHPWATNEDGNCWKCKEIDDEVNKFNLQPLEIRNMIDTPKDTITTSVMEDLKLRADRGLQKYNTTLGENNKDDFMNHLYEELLDAAQYIKKEQSFIPTMQKLIFETPNDQELGILIRKIYGK